MAEVRQAIRGLLNKVVLPDASLSAEAVNKKWEKLARAPGDLKLRRPGLSWPAEKRIAEEGKEPRKEE